MSRIRLMWQIYPSFLAITIAALIIVTWYSTSSLKKFYLDRASSDLESRAALIMASVDSHLDSGEHSEINWLCKDLGEKSSTRFTVVLPDGKVVGDSEEDPSAMDNHGRRPEVLAALSGDKGESIRFSQTIQQNLMYVALPLLRDGNVMAVVRAAFPITSIEKALSSIYRRIILGGIIAAILAAIVSLAISRRLSRPLEELKIGAEQFASGNLSYRLPVPDSREIGALAESMNGMAVQLNDRINMIINQRNEQKAILTSMVEGVLAVDTDEKFLTMNQAAGALLGTDPENVIGRSLQEIIRNSELQAIIHNILQTGQAVEQEIVLHSDSEKRLQAHGAILHNKEDKTLGALIVLNDVTRLRRLEEVRREFVANVSHELKTPVTSIKGFIETLMDGAIEDRDNAMHFLGIVARQTDRLNAIISDLLLLSRVEQEAEKAEVKMLEEKIIPIIKSAIEVCELKAGAKNIELAVESDNLDIAHRINAHLFEQAIINLVDNAIKHSPENSSILIKVFAERENTKISIIDNGCGIKKVHLPRLFERFYRIDKARSQESGGTGLGLAIVKHIVLAHGGTIEVESTFGEGSSFTIAL